MDTGNEMGKGVTHAEWDHRVEATPYQKRRLNQVAKSVPQRNKVEILEYARRRPAIGRVSGLLVLGAGIRLAEPGGVVNGRDKAAQRETALAGARLGRPDVTRDL